MQSETGPRSRRLAHFPRKVFKVVIAFVLGFGAVLTVAQSPVVAASTTYFNGSLAANSAATSTTRTVAGGEAGIFPREFVVYGVTYIQTWSGSTFKFGVNATGDAASMIHASSPASVSKCFWSRQAGSASPTGTFPANCSVKY